MPYPWQWDVGATAGEIADDGASFHYRIVVVVLPRRAGKSALTFAVCLDRLDAVRDCRAWYTMQSGVACTEMFRAEWAPSIDGHANMERLYRLRRSEGRETIEKRHGGSARVRMFAPEKDALHGMNADLVVVDEAWAFNTDQGQTIEDAVRPAQLTRPWRQLWIVSAGGTLESTWLDRWMELGESGADGVALFDYGADPTAPGYDPGSPDVWQAAHPTAGYGFPLDALATEWATRRDDASFERAYLNVWPRPSKVKAAAGVDLAGWADAAHPDTPAERVTAIAVDVAGDRSAASIVTAGPAGDRTVVELVDHRPGVGWVAAAVRDLRRAHPGVPVVADSIVAASIVAELARARVTVDPVGAGDHARACGLFVDTLAAGRLWHRSQGPLDDALIGAARRPLGDAWLWSRARSGVDISPLVAATLAAWTAATRPPAGRAAVVAATSTTSPPDRRSAPSRYVGTRRG